MDNTVLRVLALVLILLVPNPTRVEASSRIKDIGHFAGVRSNPLSGYGLVIGLNKTGDKRQTVFSAHALVAYDISDLAHLSEVSRVTFDDKQTPH